ncbi:MAG: cytochrome b/b6 domain-containing protein [Pseudomonadota bacterium]
MPAKSSNTHYGTVAVTLHWLSALLILILIGSGFRADGMENPAIKADILKVHIPIGVVILLLTLGRIGWWLFADKKPVSVPMPSWQSRSAQAIHFLFYVAILGMVASGIGIIVLSGAGPLIFVGEAAALPSFEDYAPRTPHGIGARILLALFVVHAGAALYHHVFKKDGLLRRMWY